jgi:hypothetical protein
MDGARFDRLARKLHSRRAVARAFVGGGAALGFGRAAQARVRPACFVTGEKCDPNNQTQCCSGDCKKHKGKHTCAANFRAFGCTTDRTTDFCRNGGTMVDCPNPGAEPGSCLVSAKKKPLCFRAFECVPCHSDADCVIEFGILVAVCVKACSFCDAQGGSACVVPSL